MAAVKMEHKSTFCIVRFWYVFITYSAYRVTLCHEVLFNLVTYSEMSVVLSVLRAVIQ